MHTHHPGNTHRLLIKKTESDTNLRMTKDAHQQNEIGRVYAMTIDTVVNVSMIFTDTKKRDHHDRNEPSYNFQEKKSTVVTLNYTYYKKKINKFQNIFVSHLRGGRPKTNPCVCCSLPFKIKTFSLKNQMPLILTGGLTQTESI